MSFENFDSSVLLEMLMIQSEKLSQMFKANVFDQQYDECKAVIHQIQTELESRNVNLHVNPVVTNPGITFDNQETTL